MHPFSQKLTPFHNRTQPSSIFGLARCMTRSQLLDNHWERMSQVTGVIRSVRGSRDSPLHNSVLDPLGIISGLH